MALRCGRGVTLPATFPLRAPLAECAPPLTTSHASRRVVRRLTSSPASSLRRVPRLSCLFAECFEWCGGSVKRATPGKRTEKKKDQNMSNTTSAEFNKYIVLTWQGREQVTVFPFQAKHADIFRYVRQECGDVQAISAGFYINEPDAFWCGGESDTLNLKSRPEDRQLLQAFFESEDREQWDLTQLSAQAQAQARVEMAEAGWC